MNKFYMVQLDERNGEREGEVHVSTGRIKEITEATFNDLDGIITDMTSS